MSWVITAVALGVFTADTQIKAGKAQGIQLEMQADQEKVAAQGRELARREQLNKVLSQSIAAQSQAGISGEGTPQSIALGSAKTASLSEGLESLSDKLRQAQLKRQAKGARQGGRMAGLSTLLSTGLTAAQLSGGGKKDGEG